MGLVPLESLCIWLNLLWGIFSGTSNWNIAICKVPTDPGLHWSVHELSALALFKRQPTFVHVTMVNDSSGQGVGVCHPDVSVKTINGLWGWTLGDLA